MKLKIFFLLLMLGGFQSIAQKFGYIDTEYIMNKMPEYKKANEEMKPVCRKNGTKDISSQICGCRKK